MTPKSKQSTFGKNADQTIIDVISPSAMYHWFNGKYTPSSSATEKLDAFFQTEGLDE